MQIFLLTYLLTYLDMACVTYIEAYVEMSMFSSLSTAVRIVSSVLLRVFFKHKLFTKQDIVNL